MDYANFKVEVDEGIAVLRIHRPESLNALSSELLGEFDVLIDELAKVARVVVITGEGRAFVAGADIAQMRGLDQAGARDFSMLGARIFRKLELLDAPVIAAVNGFALGGGCELALACDMRIASDKAKFGQPEAGLGIIPGFSGTWRLPRAVGASKARELIYTGAVIDAAEALRIGLVSRVTSPDELLPVCMELARSIRKNAPGAVALAKASMDRALYARGDEGMAIEAEYFGRCFATADQKEGMAAFLEKRPPQFTGA